MAELSIEGVSKTFGRKAVLRKVDLTIGSGRFAAILGASGSGKTTLLRLIAGFERAESGTIRVADRLVEGSGLHVPPERRAIGYVAQEGALFPHLSVADNITFGLPRRDRAGRRRVAELLEMVGLPEHFAGRPPHQLSGGEQQRVALARALAPNPRLVLLDEPFSALDTALRADTRAAVARALASAGATAVLVTHDQPEALSMGDPVAVLRDGALIQVASPRTLYGQPADAELARFVGEAVLLPGVAEQGRVTCRMGRLPLAPGAPEGEVDVLIRPEQIRLTSDLDEPAVAATVRSVTFFGHDASVALVLADPPRLDVTARMAGFRAPLPAERVRAVVEGAVVTYARRS